jgi:hypothetical protein
MQHQLKDVVGTARRRYHKERAACHGAFEMVKQPLLPEAKVESEPAESLLMV